MWVVILKVDIEGNARFFGIQLPPRLMVGHEVRASKNYQIKEIILITLARTGSSMG